MSGLKMTEAEPELMVGPLRFADRYLEVLEPDGVTDQGPVTVEVDFRLTLAQAGSLKSSTAYA